MSRLHGRVACITGASSGLGRAMALAFAAEGAFVVCSDLQPQARGISQETETATHDLIVKQGGKAIFVTTNVKDEDQVAALITDTVKEYGRLDIMVNNAGVTGSEVDDLKPGGMRTHETPTRTFDAVMDVNVRGVFLGCKYALAQFLNQEPLPPNSRGDRTRGKIINMASIAGFVGVLGSPSYTTSKHAVVGLTKQIAVDYASDKIHCNAICPGFTETAMISNLIQDQDESAAALRGAHPWGALGQPEDIAKAAVFLASDDAAWVTGHSLVVDGGYVAQ